MRTDALEWWENLRHSEAYAYYELWYYNTDNKRKWSFQLVCASSSTIEFLYRMYFLEEDVKY